MAAADSAADRAAGGPAPLALGRETPSLMAVDAHIRTYMNWDYSTTSSRLWALYEKSKTAQWNVATDIDWSHDVRFGEPLSGANAAGVLQVAALPGSPVPEPLWNRFRWEYQAWMVSQFLHGEQGALVTTARLVETVPDMAAKIYAAAQVADEARHVEAFARYIEEKIGVSYPVNPGLQTLLRDLLSDSRWDVVYLGMQVIVEGIALAATRVASIGFGDPIITSISRMIARDEARHISFGLVALTGLYADATSGELADRDAFLLEAIYLMSQRFTLREVWENLGVDVDQGVRFAKTDPTMSSFRQLLFHKAVQVLQRIGLLSPKLRELLLAEALVRPDFLATTLKQ